MSEPGSISELGYVSIRVTDLAASVRNGVDVLGLREIAATGPQFGLGKSFSGFAPIGPWLVTPDDLPDRDDLELWAQLDGEDDVQRGRTSQMIFSVPELVEGLSKVVTLYPGDVIFTGTPAGVGFARKPPRLIQAGEHLVSGIEGIGELRQSFVAG